VELIARYQLNGEDGLECLRVHNPSFRMHTVVSVVASLAIILLGAAWLALPGSHLASWLSIGLGLGLVGLSVTQRALLTRRFRRTWNQMEPTELTVRENGVVVTERGAQSEVAWSRFKRLREGEKHFLLYRSADLYGIVPKRGFACEDDLEAFRKMAKQGIGDP
jgi:hypothetical protein